MYPFRDPAMFVARVAWASSLPYAAAADGTLTDGGATINNGTIAAPKLGRTLETNTANPVAGNISAREAVAWAVRHRAAASYSVRR
jgi:hypothetical protein